MKKITAFFLVALMLCLCACTDKNSNVTTDTETVTNTENVISDSESGNKSSENTNDKSNSNSSDKTTSSKETKTTASSDKQNNNSSGTKTITTSNEYLNISTDKAITESGKVTVTISTKNTSSKDIYGLQFSLSFSGMSIDSISKNTLPSGWSLSMSDAATANEKGGTVVLLDCNFSTPLDNRDVLTITFNSNGSGAHLSILDTMLIQDKAKFNKITGANITL